MGSQGSGGEHVTQRWGIGGLVARKGSGIYDVNSGLHGCRFQNYETHILYINI